MTEKGGVKAACDQAVQAIAALPIEEWPGWVLYILGALAAEPEHPGWHPRAQREMLDAVEHSLRTRLMYGHW